MPFGFAGSSACEASFGVCTDINGELAELSTDDFTCVLQVEQPTRGLCGRATDLQATMESIRKVLDAARTGQPLTQ
jgi:hypothetical protein